MSVDRDVCALIVNWNSAEDVHHLIQTLTSLEDLPVIVVDNGSTETFVFRGEHRDVRVVHAGRNDGYGAGMNIALKEAGQSGYSWAWLLNPDCVPEPGALAELKAHREGAVALGATQSTDGSAETVYSSAALVGPDVVEAIACSGCSGRTHRADVLTGTGLLLDVNVCLTVGAFDEQFFHYKEEYDLMWRMRAAGDIVHVCNARIIHRRGGSLSHQSPGAEYYSARNEVLFHRKNSSGLFRVRRIVGWGVKVLWRTARDLSSGQVSRRVAGARLRGVLDGVRGLGGRWVSS